MKFVRFRSHRNNSRCFFKSEKLVFVICAVVVTFYQLVGSLTDIYCECLQFLQVFSCRSESFLPKDFNLSIRILREPAPCRSVQVDYVAFTPIAASDLVHRTLIRSTWAKQLRNNSTRKFFFVLAVEKDVQLDEVELSANDDLLILDVVEHYHNLTLKIFATFDWISRKCRRAKFVVRADSDVVLSTPALQRFVNGHRDVTSSIFGYCRTFDCVLRVPFSKHCISPESYSKPVFPTYCFGFSYVMSFDVLPKILHAWPLQPYVNLDDVFVTGILPETVGGIRRIDMRRLFDYTTHFDAHGCDYEPIASAAYGSAQMSFMSGPRLMTDAATVCAHTPSSNGFLSSSGGTSDAVVFRMTVAAATAVRDTGSYDFALPRLCTRFA